MSNAGNGERTRETLRVYIDALLARAAPSHDHAERMAYAAFAFETAVFALAMLLAQRLAPAMLVLAAGAAIVLVGHLALTTQLRRLRAAAFREAFAFALIRELVLPEAYRGPSTSAAPPRLLSGGPLARMARRVGSLLIGRLSQGEAEADSTIPASLRPLAPLARVKDVERIPGVVIPLASLAMIALLAARIALAWPPVSPAAPRAAPRAPAPLALSVQTPAPAPPAAAPPAPPPPPIAPTRRIARAAPPVQPPEPPAPDPRPYWSGGSGPWRSYTSEGYASEGATP
ncbi:MAG TPA: hypothetical protein VFE03_09455 [Caulobacteraceae bacterium]|jgi:hypothetical protein|nr:hypothetical protein [Caulobacteraceae bacterium]